MRIAFERDEDRVTGFLKWTDFSVQKSLEIVAFSEYINCNIKTKMEISSNFVRIYQLCKMLSRYHDVITQISQILAQKYQSSQPISEKPIKIT